MQILLICFILQLFHNCFDYFLVSGLTGTFELKDLRIRHDALFDIHPGILVIDGLCYRFSQSHLYRLSKVFSEALKFH